MPRECGECQMCCTLMGVKQLEKHPNQPCEHQCPTGCAIHDSRPQECRTYQCQWRFDESFPEELRPDRVGCIIDIHETPLGPGVVCHQTRPNQWREDPIMGILMQLAKHHQCFVYVIHGNDRQAIFPDWAKSQQEKFDSMVKDGSIPEIYGSIIYPES